MNARIVTLMALLTAAACGLKRADEEPIPRPGDRVPRADDTVEAVRQEMERRREELASRRDEITAEALATCTGAVCDALARGEVALEMTEAQVLAATRTTDEAWQIRRNGRSTIMAPRFTANPPRDALGEVALVQLRDGRVASYSYREAQGVRVVSRPEDATTAGRANALAEMLIREGDDLVARGDLDAALDRYDRAQVLQPENVELEYRIATVLDKQLRPVEALIRYQLFLHRLELEKIEAAGDAYAKLADAIARARERIIVLENQTH
jgi:tetratricopeptide (TPR) repeat protein